MFPSQAPIYMTAVLEYTINEVLEGAGVLARLLREDKTSKVMKITPRILRLVIYNDEELKRVFHGVILPYSGGGNYVSKKHIHTVQGTFETSDEEEEVVVLEEKGGRKGGKKTSRAKTGQRRDEEDDTGDSEVEETRGSTRGIGDRDRVRRRKKNR